MNPIEVLAHLAEQGTPPTDGEAVLRVSAGLQNSLERIARETLPFVAGGGGELQFVFGPYGRGKTHFLRALSQWALERGFVTAYIDCQENQSPFKSLNETYRAIAAAMTPPETCQFIGTSGIARVVESQFTSRDMATRRVLIDRLKRNRALAPDFRNLVIAYGNEISQGDEDLAERLEALLAAKQTYRVTLGHLYSRYPDLPRPLGKLYRRNAALWLRAVLSLPQALGYAGLLVLFDETETVLLRSGPRQRQTHLAHIRTFVDHMATGAFRGCAVYYAVAEEFIEIAEENLAALSQRIDRVPLSDLEKRRNPRAVWVELDELTVPGPESPSFYVELAESIVEIGQETGLDPSTVPRLMDSLTHLARRHAGSISEGSVREYVKEAASKVANEIFANTT